MFRTAVFTLVLALSATAGAQEPRPVEALDGLDPVLLVQGKEVFGKSEFSVVRGGFEYRFSSAETKAAFEGAPERFEIQLGGACARMGTASGNPSDYVVHENRIYVFGSDECHKQFAAAPAKYLPRPAAAFTPTEAEREKGRALLDKAARALGGPALDAMTTYVEKAHVVQQRDTGPVTVSMRTMWRWPQAARLERSMTLQGREMTSATVVSADGAWFVGAQGAFPMNAAGRESYEREFGRELVPLLRARSLGGFEAAWTGSTPVDGAAAEQVRVKNGTIDVVLAIDAGSGRVLRATFTDRNAQGEVGEWVVVYGDYRPAGSLVVPFARKALFNGAPDPSRSPAIDAVTVNEPLEASLFAPAPAPARR